MEKPSLTIYHNTKGAAAFLSTSENAVRVTVCKDKTFKHIKKGNRLFFLEADLIEWLERGRCKTPAELSASCEDALVIKKKSTSK